MNTKYDLFISYSGYDNKLLENEKGWVINFARCLDIVLERLLNRRPKIILSHDLDGTQLSRSASAEIFSDTKAFICILSSDYLKSKNFNEFEDFVDASTHSTAIEVTDKSRIFKVVKAQVPFDKQPLALQQLIDYDLCSIDQSSGKSIELKSFFDSLSQHEFWPVLIDLAYDIQNLISLFDKKIKKEITNESGKTIYLAEGGSDQKYRNIIKRELQRYGYKILPDQPLPRNAKNLESTVRKYLDKSSFSIHLMDKGEVAQSTENSIVDIQNTIAADYNKTSRSVNSNHHNPDFSRLIWISPEIKMVNEKQNIQVDKLKLDAEAVDGAEVVQTPLEVFKTIIHDKARKKNSKQDQKMITPNQKSKQEIYIIHTFENLDHTISIAQYLSKEGFNVFTTVFEGNIVDVINTHREHLVSCDAAIIYYGKGNEQWLQSKLTDLKKAPGFGRTQPMKVQAVYFGEEVPVFQQHLDQHNILSIKNSGEFTPNTLNTFLIKMNKK